MQKTKFIFSLCTVAILSATQVQAVSNVGNFNGSNRSWNNGSMSTVKASAIAAGHSVEADAALSAANLANDTHFVIGEPTVTPSASELADLASWLAGGGILMMFADSSNSGLPALNNIASGIGSALSWSGSISSGSTLASGNFATEGPPYNLVGQSLATTTGTPVISGGTPLAGNYIRYEQVGAGYVFAFADRSDHNFFTPNNTTVNGKLFLNILNGAGAPSVPDAGSAFSLLGLSAICLGFMRRTVKG